jgi:hypothetical protein
MAAPSLGPGAAIFMRGHAAPASLAQRGEMVS